MKIFLWLLKCGQPGAKGRDPKGSPGQVAWRVAAVAIWISVREIVTNDIQLQLSAHLGAFSNLLLLRPCFMALHGVWGPWETGSLLGKNACICFPRLSNSRKIQGLSVPVMLLETVTVTGRLIYPKLKGLSTFEWNISVLLSPSCSFLWGRILHWFWRGWKEQSDRTTGWLQCCCSVWMRRKEWKGREGTHDIQEFWFKEAELPQGKRPRKQIQQNIFSNSCFLNFLSLGGTASLKSFDSFLTVYPLQEA